MSFQFRSWLRGMRVRRSGKHTDSTGPAVRLQRRHGASHSPATGFPLGSSSVAFHLERLEDRITPVLGPFELDGNAITQVTHDWDQVYNDAVLNPGQNTSGSIPGAVTFIHDPTNSGS